MHKKYNSCFMHVFFSSYNVCCISVGVVFIASCVRAVSTLHNCVVIICLSLQWIIMYLRLDFCTRIQKILKKYLEDFSLILIRYVVSSICVISVQLLTPIFQIFAIFCRFVVLIDLCNNTKYRTSKLNCLGTTRCEKIDHKCKQCWISRNVRCRYGSNIFTTCRRT